jgi:hypothetical protein
MSDSRHGEVGATESTTGSADVKKEWKKPTLILLGDAATLTEAQALASDDGAAGLS